MKDIKVLGIDLAKNIFQLHGTDKRGKCVLTKRISREKLCGYIANIPACLIGMEACGSAHYWGRVFTEMGHKVKLMAPQFVKPYVRSNKNDRNDARGIAEAVTRADMKFVPLKRMEQQDVLLLHRARQLLVKQRTAQSNQIRGLLAEYGVIIGKGIAAMKKCLEIIEENKRKISPRAEEIFKRLYEQYKGYEEQVMFYDKKIEEEAKGNEQCVKIMKIGGIGALGASALVATIGDASVFKNGREVSAWLGLVPKQYSSGDKIKLGGISKRGDKYVRTLLVHGARAVVQTCEKKSDSRSMWLADKKKRCGYNKAAVAQANKNARTVWAMMKTGESYRLCNFEEKQAA